MGLEAEKVDGVAGGFLADAFALGVGEAGEGVTDVNFADICWFALWYGC
jgi:hypothetical protein